jgi:hypothetical protein
MKLSSYSYVLQKILALYGIHRSGATNLPPFFSRRKKLKTSLPDTLGGAQSIAFNTNYACGR